MTIRPATLEDAPICARIVSDWVARTPWIEPSLSLAQITARIAEAMPEREIYVIGVPVEGYLSLNSKSGIIGALYLDRPGNGFGRALLERAKRGRDRLSLWTHEPNVAAHRFYEREGFHRVERNPRGNDGLAELRMEWHR